MPTAESQEPRGDLDDTRAPRLKRQMLISFAVAVATLVGLTLAVAGTLLHLHSTSAALLEVYTRDIGILSRLRINKEATRSLVQDFVVKGQPADIDAQLSAANGAFVAEARDLAMSLHETNQKLAWRQIDQLHQDLRLLLNQAVDAARSGRSTEALTLMARANGVSLEADTAYDDLVQLDARRADGLAGVVDGRLFAIGLWTLLILAIGLGAMLLLLRRALEALGAYVDDTHLRISDLDLFAARVVHDIRQPLTSIGLALAMSIKTIGESPISATLTRSLGTIRRLSDMAESLLNFSRSGTSVDRTAVTSPSEVVQEVIDELGLDSRATGIVWKTALAPSARVRMGHDPLRTVVWNLMENAVKYVDGAAEKRISISVEDDPSNVAIRIDDSGPGIPAELLPRVFEPFYRATVEKSGFGLGLATVRRLVTAHGGDIQMTSIVGQGTEVRVRLPSLARPSQRSSGPMVRP